MRVIRKAIGLLIVDFVIIIGIFILQFRTDSSILKKIGGMQISMARADSPDASIALKNEFEVTYNGITVYGNPQNAIKLLTKENSTAKELTLLNYTEDENKLTLNFSDDIDLIFMLEQEDTESPLTIYADVPKDTTDLFVPFSIGYNMKIQKEENNRIVLEGKKQNWSLHSNELSDNYIHFTYADNLAHYAIYDDTQKFTFDIITELAEAQSQAFAQTLATFTRNLQNAFKASLSDNSFTEQAAVSYIASMANEGKYKQAIEEIPADFKKSAARTYLSAPYLNNLAAMDTKLDSYISESNKTIKNAASSLSLDIFTTKDLAKLLCIYPDLSVVRTILTNAASVNTEEASLAQATGIILTYAELSQLNTDYAALLAPAIEGCLQKITESCSYENNMLTISENDTFVSVVQAVETGIALLRYGQASANTTYSKAGRVIINSYISESSSFDLRTLSTIYPTLAYDNLFYPRILLINSYGKDAMWAWTCAKSIAYNLDPKDGLTLTIDFPLEHTHYVIFKGIPAFEQIFIYDMAFRTDPRFETYNSSGYVYKTDSKTLLLKSRHKSELENIRMSYTPVVKAAPAPAPAPKPAETAASPAPAEPVTEAAGEPDILTEATAELTTYPAGTVIE